MKARIWADMLMHVRFSLLSFFGLAVPQSSHLAAAEVSLYKIRLFQLTSGLSVLPELQEELPSLSPSFHSEAGWAEVPCFPQRPISCKAMSLSSYFSKPILFLWLYFHYILFKKSCKGFLKDRFYVLYI